MSSRSGTSMRNWTLATIMLAAFLVQDKARLHRHILRLQELAVNELELLNQISGVRIQMKFDALRRLLDLQAQEIIYALAAGKVKFLRIQLLIFVLELLRGGDCRTVIYKCTNDDEIIHFMEIVFSLLTSMYSCSSIHVESLTCHALAACLVP